MGLNSALSLALSGLNANQRNLEVSAANIANADTPGYTKKSLNQTVQVADNRVIGLRADEVTRLLDESIQRQYWSGLADASYADTRASFSARVDQAFGAPGSANALDTVLSNFSRSLETLTASPDSFAVRSEALSSAQLLASQFNGLSNEIQALRSDAERELQSSVQDANSALQQIERLSSQIVANSNNGVPPPDLLDERDRQVQVLSELFDVTVVPGESNTIRIFTGSGLTLFDRQAVQFDFDGRSTLTANQRWSANDDERGVGTLSLRSANGSNIDLIELDVLRSGRIKSLIDLRDDVLPEAQQQLDELAHRFSLALSNFTVDGTAATDGAQNGFDIDLGALSAGNEVSVQYRLTPPGENRTVTLVRVDDPSTLPLANNVTANPNDTVVGIDFSGGFASVATQIGTALGGSFTVSNTAGSTIRILDDGAANTIDITGVSASVTATALQDQSPTALPFFIDGGTGQPYTGHLDGGSQKTGFAQRIVVNPNLLQDNSLLVVHSTSPATPAGDTTRPVALSDAFKNGFFSFSADGTGIGSDGAPFQGRIEDFARQVITFQGAAAQAAENINTAQRTTLNGLETRLRDATKVNIDEEVARLTELQSAYAANARVLQAVQEMLNTLLRI